MYEAFGHSRRGAMLRDGTDDIARRERRMAPAVVR